MKNFYFLTLLSFLFLNGYSQINYEASIDFETNSQLAVIDTIQPDNVWHIGIPQKTFLDSAFSTPYAIITDTVSDYPVNNYSSFEIKILPPPNSCWGTGELYFIHKYDFEQNKDGGFIDVKYDDDATWTNIIFDTDPEFGTYNFNFYSVTDTITGAIPAFTGNSNGWVFSSFDWIWEIGVKSYFHDSLTIRFSMKSDENNTNQEGWLIDNIHLVLNDCTGGINTTGQLSVYSNIFPNPVTDVSTLEFENKPGISTIVAIYDYLGKEVKRIETTGSSVMLSRAALSKGIYQYKLIQNGRNIGSGKFVIVK